jgi:hypothetical protein
MTADFERSLSIDLKCRIRSRPAVDPRLALSRKQIDAVFRVQRSRGPIALEGQKGQSHKVEREAFHRGETPMDQGQSKGY